MATGITTREGKSGTVYQVRIRSTQVGGRAICKSFKTLKEAKVWQADTLAKINKGEGVAVAAVARLTVGDAFDDYAVTEPEIRGDIIKTLSGVIFVIIGFYFGKTPAQPISDDEDDKFDSKTTP